MTEIMTSKGDQKQQYTFFLFVGVFLVSSNVISLQILLQRFLSVVLSYHFVFIIVSLALFGLSLGGLIAYLLNNILKKYEPVYLLIIIAFAFYILISASYIFAIYTYNEIGFQKNIFIYSGIFILPFLAAGIYSARLFYSFPEICGQLYGADLIGAACGCIGIIYLFNRFGLTQALFLTTLIPLILLSLWMIKEHRATSRPKRLVLVLGVMTAAFLGNYQVLQLPEISSGRNPQKEIYDALNTFNGHILKSKDSAMGRVDLVEFADYPYLMDIYVDGTAGMPMYRFNGNFAAPDPAVADLINEFPGYFPLQVMKDSAKDDALIIGPGGGRDILLAKMAGFRKITAVEVNPEVARFVKEHADFNGKIFDQADVSLHVEEGRSFLRADSHKYDLLMFSLPVTNTSQGLGSYALTENYLYTTEAIAEYLNHLSAEGSLVFITHNDLELLRLLTMTLDSFQSRGIATADAMQHLYVVGSVDYPALVVSNQRIPEIESKQILTAALNLTWLVPNSSFFPGVKRPYLNKMLMNMEDSQATADDLMREVNNRGYDISPVTDQSPFFYKFNNKLPSSLVTVFYFSIVAVIIFVFLPFMSCVRKKHKSHLSESSDLKKYLLFSVYFAMIGSGFMIIEVTMIQRIMLVLGNPVYAMSIIIFTLLVGAGLGSLTSSRISLNKLHKFMVLALSSIVSLILAYQFSLSSLLNYMSTGSITFKTLMTVALVFPLGFAMGFPLPMAIRLIKLFSMGEIIPWMLAINGASSVFGSALTVVLAMTAGYGNAFLAAAICYAIVLLTSYQVAAEVRQGTLSGNVIALAPAVGNNQ